jgi:hypothetical protein
MKDVSEDAKPTLWNYLAFVHCRLPMAKARARSPIAVQRNWEARRRQRLRDTFQIILPEIRPQLLTLTVTIEPLLRQELKELRVKAVKTAVTLISTTEVLLLPANEIRLHQRLNAGRIHPCDLQLTLGAFSICSLAYSIFILNCKLFYLQRFCYCLQLQWTCNAGS